MELTGHHRTYQRERETQKQGKIITQGPGLSDSVSLISSPAHMCLHLGHYISWVFCGEAICIYVSSNGQVLNNKLVSQSYQPVVEGYPHICTCICLCVAHRCLWFLLRINGWYFGVPFSMPLPYRGQDQLLLHGVVGVGLLTNVV